MRRQLLPAELCNSAFALPSESFSLLRWFMRILPHVFWCFCFRCSSVELLVCLLPDCKLRFIKVQRFCGWLDRERGRCRERCFRRRRCLDRYKQSQIVF